jgi:predicted kinase
MSKIAIVMQGQSGSGKSTYVKQNYPTAMVCSADDYFIDKATGEYRFDPAKLGEAHKACLRSFLLAMAAEEELVVCDNTNTSLWELAPYVQTAAALGYKVVVVRCVASAETAAKRNTHGVPESAVRGMTDRLEKPLPFWPCEYNEVVTET